MIQLSMGNDVMQIQIFFLSKVKVAELAFNNTGSSQLMRIGTRIFPEVVAVVS